ncbi:RNA polymerase sigma factor [Vibrio coralliilyticus]|uniref:RNA polymerase sigma factor n=1 Tax=Vibrio coralliilyticus TaxID=190893 RepID=UPI00156137A1|nr:RNA polymerase sigma factor [Vibrio coralliilyticus]NRF29440.1 RNA polymerase sigma factor [Vibrio coralliilyticus]NRF52344.1 RNA polymerase sigma factor [Vibrio coralliilyticus]NRG03075.1 RNA polymerase sigma factor [Vibrio coralliilyticus]
MASTDTESFAKQDWLLCMEKVKDKDKASYALVFRHFAPRLKQFTYKHMGNEQVALELVQETMTTVWQKSHLFDGSKSSLSTWIYTIARNLCFDTLRKQRGKDLHIHSEDIWPNDYFPPDLVEHYAPEQEMLKEQVVKFLDVLPDAQKKVVQAVYLEELPHQQVADMYDIPVGTVKSRLRLAVEKLRHSIEVERL